jgi:hypothetical protein
MKMKNLQFVLQNFGRCVANATAAPATANFITSAACGGENVAVADA